MNAFEGKTAVVIGGSGGIGFEISKMLLKNGAKVVLHGKSHEKLSSVKKMLKSELQINDEKIETEAFDFFCVKPSFLGEFENSSLREKVENADILCVCFGPFLQKSIEKMTALDWQRLALLDYALPGSLVSAALPKMMKKNWGKILLFGGTGTFFRSEYKTNAAYAGAKTGLCTLVQSVAAFYAKYGIACNAILPGFVETEYLDDETIRQLKEKMPEKTLISAKSIAANAEFLLLNRDLNGVLLRVDRGWSPINN
ncbi:SDR family NAD(P)-dependent oxidoreductase [Treponema pectinovorum]|uniref:SDR family NAD(P)-dependent oxidoreductase n=1 Tax=Treponema pectinovorum TaxID=164 RepID=UPI0011CBC64F|nr:SDR family oxidoreductase [Treponema pectinovorum]